MRQRLSGDEGDSDSISNRALVRARIGLGFGSIAAKTRFFFQHLMSRVSYCYAMQVCHRDLKLENTPLDGSPAPRLKICDFGYSK
ncbi:hypothetical protein QN277_022875 [Acacia crassicarpa]|uniref:non-specific serine/threonine protein kinase n=1 Tax=Acacia crassicarpa TaxID=499986 RepID=A0AAE1JIU9_9FABA|nr:hypothetical protein QN277_022875 [Acacia crassicarpa]